MLDIWYFLTATGLTIVYGIVIIVLILWEMVSNKTAIKLVNVLVTLGTALVVWVMVVMILDWWGYCYGTFRCWVWR
jgi:hypothetical protein